MEGANGDGTPLSQELEVEKAKSTMTRWISNRDGSRVGVPEEWLDAPFGTVFAAGQGPKEVVTHVAA